MISYPCDMLNLLKKWKQNSTYAEKKSTHMNDVNYKSKINVEIDNIKWSNITENMHKTKTNIQFHKESDEIIIHWVTHFIDNLTLC